LHLGKTNWTERLRPPVSGAGRVAGSKREGNSMLNTALQATEDQGQVADLSRILYVEDDEDLRAVVSHVLENIPGIQIETCEDGQSALARAKEFRPQLVLLDVKMPGISGAETLVHLRTIPGLEDLDAIFMTTLAEAKHQQMYNMLGSLALLPKPFDLSTLADEVQEIWREKHAP